MILKNNAVLRRPSITTAPAKARISKREPGAVFYIEKFFHRKIFNSKKQLIFHRSDLQNTVAFIMCLLFIIHSQTDKPGYVVG